MTRSWDRPMRWAGIVGPVAFTAAWVVGTIRQPDYSVSHEHISGLAALDAASPRVMRAGFMTLGVSTSVFAAALDRRLRLVPGGPGWGPALLAASGLAIGAAGVLQRDRMSNLPAGGGSVTRQSWVNDGH